MFSQELIRATRDFAKKVRRGDKNLEQEESLLNDLYKRILDTKRTYKFIEYFKYDLPTISGINRLLNHPEEEMHRI